MIAQLRGVQCSECGLDCTNYSFEHITPVRGTYVAILNCDFCGTQIRLSPHVELI